MKKPTSWLQGPWAATGQQSTLLPGMLRLFQGLACAASWVGLSRAYSVALFESPMWHSASVPHR
jgi:hypothetical protein